MPWVYAQSSGELYRPDGTRAMTGYSGFLMGRNNPAFKSIHDYGPIPMGFYTIGHPYNDHTSHKTFVMDLTPIMPTSTRSGFQIHGDSSEHPGFASNGCIVVGPAIRAEIAASRDRLLEVRVY